MTSIHLNQIQSNPDSNRTRKVGSVVHQALSQILQTSISDPRISRTTITEVELSKDMKHARVFLTSTESRDVLQASVDHLNHAKSYIRHCLSDHLELKYTPALRFFVDELPSRSARVLQLIDETTKLSKKVQ